MALVVSAVLFLIAIFAPWWLDPFFDRLTTRRPYPRLCLAIITTAIGFTCGAVFAAWATWKFSGEVSQSAAYLIGGAGGLLSLVSTLAAFRRTGWLED